MVLNQLSPPKSKKALAEELGVSRSSLYYKPKLPEKDLKLKAEIERVMSDNKAYGHRRVADALDINKKRAKRVMKLKIKFGHLTSLICLFTDDLFTWLL